MLIELPSPHRGMVNLNHVLHIKESTSHMGASYITVYLRDNLELNVACSLDQWNNHIGKLLNPAILTPNR
jgi:hypothetical protein